MPDADDELAGGAVVLHVVVGLRHLLKAVVDAVHGEGQLAGRDRVEDLLEGLPGAGRRRRRSSPPGARPSAGTRSGRSPHRPLAELAGLDTAQILAAAIAERDLAGARDIPSVLDARLRYRLGALVPRPAGPWSAQLPAIADPERRAYLIQITVLMDARKDRLGEHAAEHAFPWAVHALGPSPITR
jgi:hypothetical protein